MGRTQSVTSLVASGGQSHLLAARRTGSLGYANTSRTSRSRRNASDGDCAHRPLALLHLLKREVSPSRNMISQYALGRHGWLMALCFASFSIASACLFAALIGRTSALVGRIGLAFLLAAAVGMAMAAQFRMDPPSTPPAQMSYSGKMHGVSFLIGAPGQLLATLLVYLGSRNQSGRTPMALLLLTAVVWLSFAIMIVIMLVVGPGKKPDPTGPERFLGWPNRLFMIAYAAWLMVAAWNFVG